MNATRSRSRIPILGSFGRTARLTWVEITKLFAGKFFPFVLIITALVAISLGFAGKHFGKAAQSLDSSFKNYSLWVVTAAFSLQLGTVLLMALGAMMVSHEATERTLNTMLARPFRRFEFLLAKMFALVFAVVLVVAVAVASGFVIGATVPPRTAYRDEVVVTRGGEVTVEPWLTLLGAKFYAYGDVLDPDPEFPDTLIATQGEVIRDILYGFVLLIVPILAGASVGFLLGVLLDSTALAVGFTVSLFVFFEASKFLAIIESLAVLHERIGRYSYGAPISKLAAIMLATGGGKPPDWDSVMGGIQVSALYVVGCLFVSLVVFCRRDVTL